MVDEKAGKDTAMVVAIWSILKGVGKEIHFLTAAFCKIMDRTESGARIGWIKDIVEEHLLEILPGDLVVVKRGGNELDCRWGQNCTVTEGNCVVSENMSDGQGAGYEGATEVEQGGHSLRLEEELDEQAVHGDDQRVAV